MSRLDKLSITGVRAFPPQFSNNIQFFTPLTLIVGTNGSGKTTIIECLKYATTGEQPPNTQGGSFVHDPLLVGEREIMAQVKMSFINVEGDIMNASRNMQVTVKKASRAFKTLEGSVKTKKNGEALTISSRTTEMNTLMPRFLGVSSAVLENVVFCHQDDSYWPLAPPKDLKLRFDMIFEAQKYTKAIETIKVLQKNKRVELVRMIETEKYEKANKDRGKKLETEMEKLQAENDTLRTREKELQGLIKDCIRKSEEAWTKASEAGKIVGELRGKRIERKAKEESVESLGDTLDVLSENDEQLQQMLDEYDEQVSNSEHEANEQKQRYAALTGEVKAARDRGSAKERECGAFEEQKQSYDRSIAKRQRLVKDVARAHSIRGFDVDADDTQVQAFIERVSKMARDQTAAFERARRETQEELQSARNTLQQIYEQKSALNQSKESARQAVEDNNRRISDLQLKLDKIEYDEGTTATLESKLKETENRLVNLRTDSEQSTSDSQISAADVELRRLEETKESFDAELVEATRRAGDTAQLDIRQKELKDAKRGLDTMTSAHKITIASLVNLDWNPDTLETDYQHAVSDRSSAVLQAERHRDGTVAEQKQIEFKLSSCREDLSKKQTSLKAAHKAIKEAVNCEPEDYPQEVRDLETSRDILRSDKESIKMITKYFDECLKFAKEHDACRTCSRKFNKSKENEHMVKIVEKERDKLQASREDEEQLKIYEEDLKAARDVSTDFDTWERLKNKEIPALQAEESRLTSISAELNSRIEKEDAVVHERIEAKRELDSIARNVQKISKYMGDISRLEADIQDLTNKQSIAGMSRGLESIQDDSRKTTEDMRAVRGRLARLTSERDRIREQLRSLEIECQQIKSKLSTAEFQLREKQSFENQIDAFKTMNGGQRDSMKKIDSKLNDLEPKHSTAQEQCNDIERRGQEKDRELQAQTTNLNSSASELQMASDDIEAYHARGGPAQLSRGRREVEQLKSEVVRLEAEQSQIVQRVKQLEELLRNQTNMKRRIGENQRYRRDQRQLNAVVDEINELEQYNAETEQEHWEHQGKKFHEQRNRLAAEQATAVGQLTARDDRLNQMIKEYETDGKNAAFEYRKAHVMVETTKAAVDDLGRYGSALDKAIMKYHSLKMAEVNSIIKELWHKTYQGTDVDTILIRSESETVKANKSYNYRVCMVKQEVEMDMRGRCSAGQKVLACIIIRLALAECFGVNCGMIALDEPTTNLDTENIRALAKSLSEIIRQRRQQHNFQLIVITHDEDFLRQMSCSEFCDYYYRVSRDQNQKSKIMKQSIADVI